MERLGIVVAVDGTLEASNGLKLTGQGANQLGEELDTLNSKTTATAQTQGTLATATEKVGTTSQGAAQGVAQLGRELAQGDYAGVAMKVGQLATQTGVLRAGMTLAGGAIGIAAVGLTAWAVAAYQGSQEERKLNDSLILTGNYAGLVAGQLDVMASSLARSVNGNAARSSEVLTALAGTGRVTTESLESVGAAALLVQRFTGQTSEQVVKQFAAMSDGVASWAAKQNDAYHFLTLETYNYIKTLEEQGLKQEAMKVAGEALKNHLKNDLGANLGYIDRAWKALGDTAANTWKSMKDTGKTETTDQILDKGLAYAQQARTGWMARTPKGKADLAAMDDRNAALRLRSDSEKGDAANKSAQQKLVQKNIKLAESWGKIEDQNRTKVEQMTKALKEARDAGVARGVPEDDIKRVEGRIREKYDAKPRAAGRAPIDREPENERRVLANLMGVNADYMEQLTRLQAMRAKGLLTEDLYIQGVEQLIAKQPGVMAAAREQADALRIQTQYQQELERAKQQYLTTLERNNDAQQKTNEKLREHTQEIGLTKEQLGYLRAARLDDVIAQEKQNLATAESNKADDEKLALMREHIKLLEEQRGLQTGFTEKSVAYDAQKTREDASRKFGDDIKRDLKDGLMRGFEAGKNPAQTLADTMGNMIKQRLVSAFVDSILNSFEPLINSVMANIKWPGGVGGGSGSSGGGGGVLRSLVNMGISYFTGGFSGASTNMTGNSLPTAGGRAGGGPVQAGSMYEVNERGPELLQVAGKQYLMMGGQNGNVIPNAGGAPTVGGGNGAPVINIIMQPGMKAETKQKKNADGGMNTDVIISHVEDALAGRLSSGTGSMFDAMSSRFGLNTAVR